MRYDLFISGFGGQGVLLAGNLLAYAAINEGKNASFFPEYGVEKRGGSAMCTVVIADGEVGSPVIGNPSTVILLNQLSMDKFQNKAKKNGLCIVNSSLIHNISFSRDDLSVHKVPMNDIAMELGDSRMANMVALGAYIASVPVVKAESLFEALKDVLPERNHRFIPANIKAIEAGIAAVSS
ncbi:MAG: 2-oxoacid:acceptor oxidoreductase family protein [Desulfuromonadales bacterium]|nr:2-oxoacid:acceptor oxidoreductase family protein [Desulfuromonadales bacterium]